MYIQGISKGISGVYRGVTVKFMDDIPGYTLDIPWVYLWIYSGYTSGYTLDIPPGYEWIYLWIYPGYTIGYLQDIPKQDLKDIR